jgi:hypothetical protein
MAKQIVILGYTQDQQITNVDCVFWFPVSSGQLAQADGSVWAGASTAESTAIQNGSVLEERRVVSFPTGLDVTSMKATLQSAWNSRNTAIAGKGPSLFNGVFLDGTTGWSA